MASEWTEGRYASWKLSLADGLEMLVHWESVRRGESGYKWSGMHARGIKLHPTLEEAQAAAETYARRTLTNALANLPNREASGE